MFKIPSKIEYVIDTLNKKGFDAFIVGGCVRDMLLGKTPNDFDVATNALPTQVESIFEKTVPTGIKHGTVTVLVGKEPVEVTTFRIEGEYTDSRRPKEVEFVANIKEDLFRRDFTVNALAYSKNTGIIDCVGGRKDLENKILRAVGNPEKRFKEDALRILRLFRFACQLDFNIEEKTLKSALELIKSIEKISRERIFTELYKLSLGKTENAEKLFQSGGLEFLKITKRPDYSLIDACKKNEKLCFFAFINTASDSPLEVLQSLKASNALKDYFSTLKELLNMPYYTKYDVKNLLNRGSLERVNDLADYLTASGKNGEQIKEMCKEIINNGEPYSVRHLKINGNHLKSMGYKGEEIKKHLENLRLFICKDPKNNEYESLIQFLSNQ